MYVSLRVVNFSAGTISQISRVKSLKEFQFNKTFPRTTLLFIMKNYIRSSRSQRILINTKTAPKYFEENILKNGSKEHHCRWTQNHMLSGLSQNTYEKFCSSIFLIILIWSKTSQIVIK